MREGERRRADVKRGTLNVRAVRPRSFGPAAKRRTGSPDRARHLEIVRFSVDGRILAPRREGILRRIRRMKRCLILIALSLVVCPFAHSAEVAPPAKDVADNLILVTIDGFR